MSVKEYQEIMNELDAMIAELEAMMGDEVLQECANMAMAPA